MTIIVCVINWIYFMGVPENIRAVPRPRNTVVIDSGSNGAKSYSVYARLTSICRVRPIIYDPPRPRERSRK